MKEPVTSVMYARNGDYYISPKDRPDFGDFIRKWLITPVPLHAGRNITILRQANGV